jgi:hypothetical protein
VTAVDENELTALMLGVQKEGAVEACRQLLARDPALLNMRAEDGTTTIMLGMSISCQKKESYIFHGLSGNSELQAYKLVLALPGTVLDQFERG